MKANRRDIDWNILFLRLTHPYQTYRETVEVRKLMKMMDGAYSADEKFEIFVQILDCRLAIW